MTDTKSKNLNSWLAIVTRANQELTLSERIAALGVEVYAPSRLEFRQRSDRKVRLRIPIVKNLIFLRMPPKEAYPLINENFMNVHFMTDCTHKQLLIIPDRQMEDFQRVLSANETAIVVPDCYEAGQRVLIKNGALAGTEVEVVRYKNENKICVRLFDGLCALVEVLQEDIEPIAP